MIDKVNLAEKFSGFAATFTDGSLDLAVESQLVKAWEKADRPPLRRQSRLAGFAALKEPRP